MDNDSGQTLWSEFSGIALNRYVTESLESEVRFGGFDAAAFQRVLDRLLRGSQIFRIKVSLFVEYFRMVKCDNGSGRTLRFQSNPANHVLAHVGDSITRWRSNDGHRSYLFSFFHRGARRRNQIVLGSVDNPDA